MLEGSVFLELGLVFLVESVFALFQPPLLVADFIAGLFHLPVEVLPLIEQLVLGLELRLLDDVLGFFSRLSCNLSHSGQRATPPQPILNTGKPVADEERNQSG